MKLEIKHLAGYLPYGLKGIYSGRETEIEFISKDGLLTNDSFQHHLNYSEFKPILRPLSDLTKDIEVNGEKFVPSIKVYGLIDIYDFSDIKELSFETAEQLLEWHFDIYGLIDSGLAIDINKLNK